MIDLWKDLHFPKLSTTILMVESQSQLERIHDKVRNWQSKKEEVIVVIKLNLLASQSLPFISNVKMLPFETKNDLENLFRMLYKKHDYQKSEEVKQMVKAVWNMLNLGA